MLDNVLVNTTNLKSCVESCEKSYDAIKKPLPKADKIRHEYVVHGYTLYNDYHWLRDSNWPKVKDSKYP